MWTPNRCNKILSHVCVCVCIYTSELHLQPKILCCHTYKKGCATFVETQRFASSAWNYYNIIIYLIIPVFNKSIASKKVNLSTKITNNTASVSGWQAAVHMCSGFASAGTFSKQVALQDFPVNSYNNGFSYIVNLTNLYVTWHVTMIIH